MIPAICIVCGKKLPRHSWGVNYDTATNEYLRPEETRRESGLQPVGSECIKKIPPEKRIRWRRT